MAPKAVAGSQRPATARDPRENRSPQVFFSNRCGSIAPNAESPHAICAAHTNI